MSKNTVIDPQQGLAELHLLDTKKAEELAQAYDKWEAQMANLLGEDLYMQCLALMDAKQAQLDEVAASWDDRIKTLQDQIKAAAVHFGTGFKSGFYRVDYVQPSTSWDGKGLAGYAVAHPEIWAFASQKPSFARLVSLKK